MTAHEFRDVWLQPRGAGIVFAFSLLLSALTYLAASNEELNILDQKGTVDLVLQITLAVGIAASLLMSADAISGERERGTLESLLLTPVPRRQIVFGKLIAAASVWPAMMVVAIPYLWVLQGDERLLADAVLGGVVVGGLLTAAFASFGLIVSIFSNSNRLSVSVGLFVLLVLFAPTQLPLSGWFGDLMVKINPADAGSTFLTHVVVKGHAWNEEMTLLIAPLLAALIATGAALAIAGGLRLQGGVDR